MEIIGESVQEFDSKLAPYASRHDNGLGRRFAESSAADRNEFQRDSTRVMHSSAFRRLQYKTQVFSNQEGDLFRTRLTHSLEVGQVSRASARALRLNEDLVETLALAHDLGHAPFGHLGQDVLDLAMKEHGGFEHNLQALRIVDHLEKAYISFEGLNLLYESREGILKHCSANNARLLSKQADESGDPLLGTLVDRFLPEGERKFSYKSPSLEAQLTDWCDAVAYTHADMEDAVTMGILTLGQLADEVPLFKQAYDLLAKKDGVPKKGQEAVYAKVASGVMMKLALSNLIENSKLAIDESKVETIEDVRNSCAIIRFSPDFHDLHHIPFKRFLRREVYSHPEVDKWRVMQKEMMRKLFSDLAANPGFAEFDKGPKSEFHRRLCDHLSSMTDRSATKEFQRVKELVESKSARRALSKGAKF